jgi:S1-C subfamily serine protease
LARLRANPEWITNSSLWWGRDNLRIAEFRVLEAGDIAVGLLEGFDPASIANYPVFKNPESLPIGTSLCKLGFPFHEASAQYDEATGMSALAPGTLPVPRFPIEGIYTRNFLAGHDQQHNRDILFIETSSPGLKGQSGGPVFDVNGVVWGIQSHTRHFPLGFSPKVTKGGKETEENQFLNVGYAAHPSALAAFLNENGVAFRVSDN